MPEQFEDDEGHARGAAVRTGPGDGPRMRRYAHRRVVRGHTRPGAGTLVRGRARRRGRRHEVQQLRTRRILPGHPPSRWIRLQEIEQA
ncbi:hypothetical protein [Streptomyces sp. 1222.5]|uniref:hypothetical protein n=1 Tax=Streptomyces sp. 1222.5 TaxID=1881026 RepID=UPI003EC15024